VGSPRRNAAVVRICCHTESTERTDKNDWTPLICASSIGRTDLYRNTGRSRAKLDPKRGDEFLVLDEAVRGDHTDMLKMLVKRGLNVNVQDHIGFTV